MTGNIRPKRPGWPVRIATGLLASSFLLLIGIPLASLLLHESPATIWAILQEPETLQAMEISIITTSISTCLAVVFGLPVAYILARLHFRGRSLIETVVTLPTVLPPVVAGIALLLTFSRMGLLGSYLNFLGITVPFTTTAVIMAQTFVAAPFFINSARAGLEQFDWRYEQAAQTLRATPLYTFFHIVLPLIRPALLSGIGQTWARALGEFGATITFAGNFPGVTQTLPIAVYIAAQSNLDHAIALAVVLLAISFGLLFTLRIGHRTLQAI